MRSKVSRIGKLTFKVLRSFFYFLLAIVILLNLFIVLSGRFYLYKGIANTYLVGKTGPGIYDLDVFPYTTIAKGKTIAWKEVKPEQTVELSKNEKKYMGSLETKAFLVFRGDSLLFEKYFNTHARNTVSNSFSAAKTVVALLVGIAVEEGHIKSIDEPVGNYIPEFNSDDKKTITIRHLLQMASGLDWEESAKNPLSENAESYYGTDLYGLVTRQKLATQPGRTFIYQSGNSQLLGIIVEKATGKSVTEYTQEKIWKKIGAEHEAFWSLDKDNGDEKAFCCLYATARDFGRLGKMIMNYGKFGSAQIVPKWYMDEMFDVPPISTEEGITNKRYGLHIWHYNAGNSPVYYCRGIKGQYIMSIPSENLVIVRLGMERKDNFALPKDVKVAPERRKEMEKMVGHPKDFFDYLRIGRRIAAETK
jgi:CubicO group peptidase (beta-lactamase class C family)